MDEPASTRRRWLAPVGIGCVVLLVAAIAVPVAGGLWWRDRAARAHERRLRQQEEQAAAVFEPARDKLRDGSEERAVDLDDTIRVVHGLDLALREHDDLEAYLRTIARQDYRGVAPEVLEARARVLDVLQPLYAKQTELEDQRAMWDLTSEMLLATLSVVGVSGKINVVNPSGAVEVDRAQAEALWKDLKDRQAERRQLQRDVQALDQQLFDALVDYADTYWKYVDEWDRLSVLRDRAYLAAHAGDWEAALASASLAIERAPTEREAHLLAAMAILEAGNADRFPEAKALLEESIAQHPDQTAPALLLLGVLAARTGDTAAARLNLQQAAAYYPKQSDALLDMLDPYRMRAFLEKSREGGYIVELYRSTMLGSGYFSPDLQLARLHFEEGDFEAGRAKVLDHFARRRAQQQWDFVIGDIEFCQGLLGADFRKIFPEDAWLDLQVSRPLIGSGLGLAVVNRGDRTLHNATLVLALHLTDQFPGQYTAIPAPTTVPAVVAHDTTSFGSLDPELQVAGQPKTVDDIVEHRAILIADEAVVWVDTDAFKIAEADEFRKAREAARAGVGPAVAAGAEHAPIAPLYGRLVQSLTGAELSIDPRYGADDVRITLPRELAILHPVFRLWYGGADHSPVENLLDTSHIRLKFASVANFDDASQPRGDLALGLSSPFGELVLRWSPTEGGGWAFQGVAPGG